MLGLTDIGPLSAIVLLLLCCSILATAEPSETLKNNGSQSKIQPRSNSVNLRVLQRAIDGIRSGQALHNEGYTEMQRYAELAKWAALAKPIKAASEVGLLFMAPEGALLKAA